MLNFASLMIGTSNPQKLALFYEKVFGKKPELDDQEWYGWQVGNAFLTIGPHSEVKGAIFRTYTPIIPEGDFDDSEIVVKANSQGVIEFGVTAYDRVTGGPTGVFTDESAELITLTFTAKPGSSGQTSVSVHYDSSTATTDSNIVINPNGGVPEDILLTPSSVVAVTIQTITPSSSPTAFPTATPIQYPTPTPTPIPTPMPTPLPTPVPTITPTPVPTPTSTPILLTPSPTFIPTPAPSGDIISPVVIITTPPNGARVRQGSRVWISATASDNIGVTKVTYFINGQMAVEDTSVPYTYFWTVPEGAGISYIIQAVAIDAAGNTANHSITVTSY